jgi:alkylresorcinol/alkylpyrone synthase
LSERPRIRSVATAVPRHPLPQTELRELAGRLFARDFPNLPRLLRVFDNAGIERRQLARPVAWYEHPRGFPEKNEAYVEQALPLAEQAARQALEQAALPPASVGAVVFVSSTGVATPSLDGALVQRLDLRRSVARLPLWGLGCAGGAAGVARAAALARGLGQAVLLVSVEICSVTFVHEDRSRANLVATALFGDGAAAVVIAPGGEGPAVLGGFSHLIDDSADVMGWTLRETGLQVRFARSIPAIVREHVPGVIDTALAEHGLEREAVEHWVLHPGGAKVLTAYEDALGLAPDRLAHARAVLRDHGNMSSPTVLFVLERWMQRPSEGPAVLMSLGPGFCAEGALLQW